MSLLHALFALLFFVGAALVLERVRPLRRVGLSQRVRPYVAPTTSGDLEVSSSVAMTTVLAPLADTFGGQVARLMGVRTSLDLRLLRAGRTEGAQAFRLAQLIHALVVLAATSALVVLVGPGLLVSLTALLGTPVLSALLDERRLDSESRRQAELVSLELPVIAEQLGILLGAGLSLGAALDRMSRRSNGVVAAELATVVREVRRGRSETEALRDWAETANSTGVERLVSVLALHRDASDLGSLISTEARAIRDQTHRDLIESIEKRAQLVWVPVTVATLLPGLILIGVPFVRAMSAVAG